MGDTAQIRLSRRLETDEPPAFATIDAADMAKVSKFRWFQNSGYAYTRIRGRRISMQRFIMIGASQKRGRALTVDHINHDTLDNRRANLRICTHADNMRNRARWGDKLKGVLIFRGKWRTTIRATISKNGEAISLGRFNTNIEAAQAYDDAARRLFGEFAAVNFPDGKIPAGIKTVRASNVSPNQEGRMRSFSIRLPDYIAEAIRSAAEISGKCTGTLLREVVCETFKTQTQKAA